MPAEPVVLTKGLTRRFGPRVAVDGIDLTVQPGEFVTLLGPNGAGKTTLLRLLCGLLRASAGQVRVLGADLARDPAEAKRRIGFIGHASFLYAGLTAVENLRFYARLYGLGAASGRIAALLERVGLADRADELTRGFSRGMLQRLTIARALLHDPEAVFLDEPFTGLDQEAARTLGEMLADMRSRGRTVVLVTHNLREGLEKATRVILLSRGRVSEDRPASGMTLADLEALYASGVAAWTS